MEKYRVAYGESRKAKKWKNSTITWPELRERLQHPLRTSETQAEYSRMKSSGRSIAKDKGGFVAGELKDGQRKASAVICRSMLTLDLDNAAVDFLESYKTHSPYATLIYSTHSHTPEHPRLRLIIPLTRDVTPDEYNAITRLFAAEHGINQFDMCSFVPSQLMFWPTVSSDGVYVFEEVEGSPLNPDEFLAKYPQWHDPASLPTTIKERPPHENAGQQLEDPLVKEGIVGTFCRAVGTIQNAIDKYLSDVYEEADNGRYHYKGSSSIAGVLIYADKWAYSNHATDPAYHQECNAFDLIRIHRFPNEDEKKSFESMATWASSLPEVSTLILEERQDAARRAFGADSVALEDSGDWREKLMRDKVGNLVNNLHNLGLIMTNDPYMKSIVFNQLADGMEIKGPVPWAHASKFWRDADDAQLIWYVDQNYGNFSARNYEIAVTKFVDDRSYHPIKEYFSSLPAWDGVPRVDSLLVNYLGASDNKYVRAVTRKILCAAVTRIEHPGTKFDTILVLNGPQGIGKSTLIAKLGMEWFSDSLTISDMNDKTAAEKLQGYWIHEIGEMAGMKKADLEKVKGFISRQDDKYRAAFGRRVTPHPRQCVFFGTTNAENGFLRDVTGNRRYWVVFTPGGSDKRPWDLGQDEVNQIWAETITLVKNGEPLFLDADVTELAKIEQNAAMETDEREGLVRMYLETLLPENWEDMDLFSRRAFLAGDEIDHKEGTVERKTVSNMEIWCECFGNSKESLRGTDSFTIRSIMSRIEGWRRSDHTHYNNLYGRQKVYVKDGTKSSKDVTKS